MVRVTERKNRQPERGCGKEKMQYNTIKVEAKGSLEYARLVTYFLDNTEEIDTKRVRPLILLCPGGGYVMTSDREAEPIAMQFLAAGFHVAILRYSVAPARYPVALREVAWSMAWLRDHAQEYHIDKDRIITMGFSAGGHLAASYGDFWKNHEFLAQELGVDAETLRPNGQILGYPVISSGPKAHRDSFTSLLGEHYDELVDEMSLENQVNEDVPPTFLWHTETDDLVPVENSILFFNALHEHHIPVEMHIYPIGGHGISLATEETRYRDGGGIFPQCQNWIEMAIRWAKEIG